MRVLFTTTPWIGHFQPLVPLARVVAAAGHEVAFASSRAFGPLIEEEGFAAMPAGRASDDEVATVRAMAADEDIHDPRRATAAFYVQIMVDMNTRCMVPDLVDICRAWKPDILVREEAEFGGTIAAEHLGIPHAAVQVLYFFARTSLEGAVSKKLDRVRREWGLPPDPKLEALHRYLFLSFTPPSFIEPGAHIPPTMHFLQPPQSRNGGSDALPDWVRGPLQRPVIYVTMGTAMSKVRSMFPDMFFDVIPTLLEGLRAEAGTLIVTVGRDRAPEEVDPHLPNVHVERYIPQELLFPRCDLVVTHGGHNTVLPALQFGLPLVLIPFWADQPDNARRCAELGVGEVIQSADVTPEVMGSTARKVLMEPSNYREQVLRVQSEIVSLPDVGQGGQLLEQLALSKTPIRRKHAEVASDRSGQNRTNDRERMT
jgi:UDP:flavonoid glycosyltransferase YjiC (YdhE family)